jgi:hypothetical protein
MDRFSFGSSIDPSRKALPINLRNVGLFPLTTTGETKVGSLFVD